MCYVLYDDEKLDALIGEFHAAEQRAALMFANTWVMSAKGHRAIFADDFDEIKRRLEKAGSTHAFLVQLENEVQAPARFLLGE